MPPVADHKAQTEQNEAAGNSHWHTARPLMPLVVTLDDVAAKRSAVSAVSGAEQAGRPFCRFYRTNP